MTNFTEMEMIVLNILADNHGEQWDTEEENNAPHIDTYELTTDGSGQCGTIFSKNSLDPKVYRGVVSSLIQKGALEVDEYNTMKDPRKGFLPMIAVAISFDTFNEIRKAAA
jgi:hypothetical protein